MTDKQFKAILDRLDTLIFLTQESVNHQARMLTNQERAFGTITRAEVVARDNAAWADQNKKPEDTP